MAEDLARDKRLPETENDRTFVRHLVKKIQGVEPDVGGVYFDSTKMLVFYWRGVLIDKLILDKTNLEDIKMEEHIQRISRIIRMIKMGALPTYELDQSRSQMKNFNQRKTGKNIT